MKIAIYSRDLPEKQIDFVQELLNKLIINNIQIVIYNSFYKFLAQKIELNSSIEQFTNHSDMGDIDFLFSIGGDGTLLEATTLVRFDGNKYGKIRVFINHCY